MCTIVLATGVLADAPVAVAANRDERVDRPATPPTARGEPAVVAPRDERAGGTWIGYAADGLLAAIANRWVPDGPPGDRSRGRLVADALAESSVAAALRTVETELAARRYAPFALVLAGARRAVLVEWTGRLRVRPLARGVHVIVNVGADGRYRVPPDRRSAARRQIRVAERLRAALAVEPNETASAWLDRASEWLGDHRVGACVHGDGFCTRSSSLIALGRSPSFRYADGPPCRHPYRQAIPEGHL